MRPRTIEQLARVAAIYRGAVSTGHSPVDAVSARLQVTPAAAKRRIYRARRAGLLAPTRGVFDITE